MHIMKSSMWALLLKEIMPYMDKTLVTCTHKTDKGDIQLTLNREIYKFLSKQVFIVTYRFSVRSFKRDISKTRNK